MFPVCAPIFGSRRHPSSPISVIRSTEVTRVQTLDVRRKTVQDACRGRGKRVLNRVSKSLSSSQYHSATLPNDRDGMSVIAFSFPGMWTGVMGHAPLIFSRSANARTNCAATAECRDASLVTQLTVGLLSLNRATRRSRNVPHTVSITNQRNNKPAISRSEFVMEPRGLVKETRFCFISSGHS